MNIVILQGRNASRLISYDIRQLAPVRPRQVLHVAVNGSEDNATALLFASYSSGKYNRCLFYDIGVRWKVYCIALLSSAAFKGDSLKHRVGPLVLVFIYLFL